MSCLIPCDKKFFTNKKYYQLPFFGWTQWLVKDIGVLCGGTEVSKQASRLQVIRICAPDAHPIAHRTALAVEHKQGKVAAKARGAK